MRGLHNGREATYTPTSSPRVCLLSGPVESRYQCSPKHLETWSAGIANAGLNRTSSCMQLFKDLTGEFVAPEEQNPERVLRTLQRFLLS